MAFLFRKEELEKIKKHVTMPEAEESRPLWQNSLFLAVLDSDIRQLGQARDHRGPLVPHLFDQVVGHRPVWPRPRSDPDGLVSPAARPCAAGHRWWSRPSFSVPNRWCRSPSPWSGCPGSPALTGIRGAPGFPRPGTMPSKSPLLLIGVLIAGVLLGRPGHEGLIPSAWVSTNHRRQFPGREFLCSLCRCLHVLRHPDRGAIVQGLIGSGMGQGPALALLLAGPALSLPNMLVINSVLGTTKTLAFVSLVIVRRPVGCCSACGWLDDAEAGPSISLLQERNRPDRFRGFGTWQRGQHPFPQELADGHALQAGSERQVIIEVVAHQSEDTVRGIALTPTQGLFRGAPVIDTGQPLRVPVGRRLLGRMLNVFGDPIDGGGHFEDEEWRSIQPPLSLAQRSAKMEIFETGIKAIDLLSPLERGGKAGMFAALVSAKRW